MESTEDGDMTKRLGLGVAVADSGPAEDDHVDPAVVVKKLNRHLVPWLFALGTLCYLDRTNLSFAALQLNRDLQLSCSTYGLGASLFFVSYALFQMPSTLVCARLGAPTWLSANICAWGAVAALFAAANSVPAFLALRFLLGATESAAFPGMWYHLSLFYSESELGPAYAKVASCTALGQVIGAPIAAVILSMDGALGLRGWQLLFIVEGTITIVFGVVFRLVLAPSPSRARMLTHAEREWLQQRQDEARAGTGGGGGGSGGLRQQLRGILGVLRDWRILWMSGCWLLVAAVMFGMTFFMPLLVRAMFSGGGLDGGSGGGAPGHHGSCSGGGGGGDNNSGSGGGGQQPQQQQETPEQQQHNALVALATAIPFIMAAIGMNINAKLAERANERHRHAGVPILLAGVTLGAVPMAARLGGPALAFGLLSLAAGFCWSFHGPFFSWPAVFLSGEQAAAGFALINSLGAVGGFIGPYLLGLLSDRGGGGGFGTAMLVLACFLLVSGSFILAFPAPGRKPGPEEAGTNLRHAGSSGLLKGEEDAGGGVGGLGEMVGQQQWGGRVGEGDEEDGVDEERGRWQPQQQQRLRGSASRGQLGELECQPILPQARPRSH